MLLRICAFLSIAAGASAAPDGFDILFLLDVSQSMFRPETFIASGARLATYELESNDRIAVMSFSSSAKVHLGFSTDTGKIDQAFRKATGTMIRWTGARRLYDAVFTAVEQFPPARSPNRKRIVAVITNDADDRSAHNPDQLIREAKARGVAIWAFLIANPYPRPLPQQIGYARIPYPDVQRAAELLRPISQETGGKVLTRDMNGYVLRQAIAACKGNGE